MKLGTTFKHKICPHFFAARDEDEPCFIQMLDLDAVVKARKKTAEDKSQPERKDSGQ